MQRRERLLDNREIFSNNIYDKLTVLFTFKRKGGAFFSAFLDDDALLDVVPAVLSPHVGDGLEERVVLLEPFNILEQGDRIFPMPISTNGICH